MQIVTDTGMDMFLLPELMPEIPIHVVPHVITLDGKSYRSGEEIQADELQKMLMATPSFPTTSQPSAGDFAEVYRKLAVNDPDILSIQMSSGLSGTYSAASTAAGMVPEANVTVVDTKTLCAAQGWIVAAAGRAIKAGWPLDKILALMQRVGDATEEAYTLNDLKYLIHGGRISHMKGLFASMLKIRPLIGVEKVGGTYAQLGMARTFEKALQGLVDNMLKYHKPGSALRVQVLHSYNQPGVDVLTRLIEPVFKCTWMPVNYMSPVLAAHTGPSMVGVAFAAADVFNDIP